MKKRYVALIIFALAIVAFYFIMTPPRFVSWEKMTYCQIDGDCIIVDGGSYCGENIVINKKYQFYNHYQNFGDKVVLSIYHPRILCELSRKIEGTACIKNKCTPIYEGFK